MRNTVIDIAGDRNADSVRLVGPARQLLSALAGVLVLVALVALVLLSSGCKSAVAGNPSSVTDPRASIEVVPMPGDSSRDTNYLRQAGAEPVHRDADRQA